MIEDCTAIILAGGESKRMGLDKASLKLASDTLLNRSIRNMQPYFEHMIISVREPKENLLFPQLCDKGLGHGPIVGLATSLECISTSWAFVIACDMPFVSSALITAMAEKRQHQHAVVPTINGMVQPLFAFYAKGCLPILQSHIEHGQHSLKKAIADLNVTTFNEGECVHYDPDLLSFFDLDTQEDVNKAELILSERKRA